MKNNERLKNFLIKLMIERIFDIKSNDLIEISNIINDYMKTNLKMFQNWWKNTMNEYRANANVDIDSNLFLFQRQQKFDFFVLFFKTIKTMKSFNINIWSRTKKSARKNFINVKTKKIYEQKKRTHIYRIFISKNWNSK